MISKKKATLLVSIFCAAESCKKVVARKMAKMIMESETLKQQIQLII